MLFSVGGLKIKCQTRNELDNSFNPLKESPLIFISNQLLSGFKSNKHASSKLIVF